MAARFSVARNRLRTDLALIRQALDLTDLLGSQNAAAKQLGIHDKNISRWQWRRLREPEGWPTPADIAEWQADNATHGIERRRRAATEAAYLNRTYLNRGP